MAIQKRGDGETRVSIGLFAFDPVNRLLYDAAREVKLPPKACDVLALLVRHSGGLISHAQVLNEIWPEGVVSDGSLTQVIYLLRKALSADPRVHIVNIPRRGYALRVDQRPARLRTHSIPRFAVLGTCIAALLVVAVGLFVIGRRAPLLPQAAAEQYALGLYHLAKYDKVDEAIARRFFEEAIKIAPTFPNGYAGLAMAYANDTYDPKINLSDSCSRGYSSAAEALSLGPSGIAHTAEAVLNAACLKSLAKAEPEIEAAQLIGPPDPLTLRAAVRIYLWAGRTGDALRSAERLDESDPNSPVDREMLGQSEFFQGDSRAQTTLRDLLSADPSDADAVVFLESYYDVSGQRSRALQMLKYARQHDLLGKGWSVPLLARLEAENGKLAEADRTMSRASKTDPLAEAVADVALKRFSAAITRLRMIQSHNAVYAQMLWLDDPRLRVLHSKYPGANATFVTLSL